MLAKIEYIVPDPTGRPDTLVSLVGGWADCLQTQGALGQIPVPLRSME